MNSEELGDALSWLHGTAMIDALDDQLLASTEAALVTRTAASVVDVVNALDPVARQRVLRAPEVTRRLLFPSTAPADTDRFLARAAAVEMALLGRGRPPAVTTWSALGDVVVMPDGTIGGWPQLEGDDAVPLDFGSPWAQHVDLTGRDEFARSPRPTFTSGDIASVYQRVADATALVADLSHTIAAFVARATCVIVLQIDGDAPQQVASGTNGHYVGRSFVTNPHRPEATPECLAEAIVHEAVHGLLYREGRERPWVMGDAAEEVPRVESPWTGRALPVRAFLEATCVWFGLAHMWALACKQGTFDVEPARAQLVRSVRGFGRGSLADRVRPWQGEIRADVLETVDGLHHRVRAALVGAA